MPWVKLDDGFWMHPRATCAGNAGAGIFTRMLSYCGRYLTDGLVPANIVESIVGPDRDALGTLAQFGLIQLLESGSVVIPDYLDYNRSRLDMENEKRAKSAGGKRSAVLKRAA